MQKAKTKITLLIVGIICLIALLGVSVYAVVTQAVDVQTYITVKDDGQAKCAITVSDFVAPSNNSTLSQLAAEPEFVVVLEKGRDENEKSGNFSQNVQFSYKNYYRYFLIKVEIENLSTVAINYNLSLTDLEGNAFNFSYPIVYNTYEKTGDADFQLSAASSSGVISVSGSATKYIAIMVTDGYNLWDLPDIIEQPFKLNVEVSV